MALIIEARLGRGRTVETFAAKLDERPVVIKRARAELSNNPVFNEALAAWGQDQQRLRHLSLASVLSVERGLDGVMVVQERVDGASLSAVLRALKKSRRSLHPTMALGIAREIASALAYLHTAEVHHGGIDPGEVLLSYIGQAKLSDPMLRSLDEAAGVDLDPVQEVSLYKALEASRGAPNDVYAAGLVLLEMLLGQPLWTKERMNVAAAISALKDYTPLGQAQPELTERLTQLLRGCLKEDAGDRINAVVMVAAIEHVLAHHQLGFEPSALGALVKAAVPPPDTADAPTMMVDPAKIEAQAQAQAARMAQMENASVPVDPELEAKALTRAGRPPSTEGGLPLAVVTPMRSSGTPGLVTAPSIKRENQGVPDVAKIAMQTQAAFDRKGPERRTVLAVVGGMMVVFMLWLWLGRSDDPVRLTLESDPPGAVVVVNGQILGVTPIDRLVEPKSGVIKLQFELDGYEPHAISIGTEESEIRYEAHLKKKAE